MNPPPLRADVAVWSPDRKQHTSSLHSVVCWYQQHSGSCPHEPQLRALEPQPDSSTAAVWQCDSDHSLVQYLFSPPGGASGSEHEEEAERVATAVPSRSRRKEEEEEVQRSSRQSKGDRTVSVEMKMMKMMSLSSNGRGFVSTP